MAKHFFSRHQAPRHEGFYFIILSSCLGAWWQISLGSGLSALGFNPFMNFITLFFHLIRMCFIFFMIKTQQVKDAVH